MWERDLRDHRIVGNASLKMQSLDCEHPRYQIVSMLFRRFAILNIIIHRNGGKQLLIFRTGKPARSYSLSLASARSPIIPTLATF